MAVVISGGWWLFEHGLKQAGFERELLAQKESEWLQQRAELEKEIVKQREHATRLEQGNQVEKEAYQHLQDEVTRLHGEVSNLKDELTFYRDIVSPESDRAGLSVRGLLLSRMEEKDRYRYKIVVTKVPNDGNLIRGNLTFEIEGNEGDAIKRYNLEQISLAKKPTSKISFRFKYFQNLSGEMRLPEGFEPTKVMLTLNPDGKKLKKSVEQFDWIVEEN
ncbi:MAG: hypothetical protein OQK78_10210 [Gammaproteobacteria bacterium]|nr:hypothetical protein [Gammaproteobacteria bacterium]